MSGKLHPSSATSKARSASKIATQDSDMRSWVYQHDLITHIAEIPGSSTETTTLPDIVSARSIDILKISIPPDLSGREDVNLRRNYGSLFERPKYNQEAAEILLQEIAHKQAKIGANYPDGTNSFIDKQSVVDAVNMSVMIATRLAFDKKRTHPKRTIVHQTYEATCRIPIDFFFESAWARRRDEAQILAHEPTWKLPKPRHPETLDTTLEPKVVRPDAIVAVQIASNFGSLDKALLACLNLVDHLPPNKSIWDTLDFAYLIVEYKRGHLAESAALSQLMMAMTSALCHLAHFGVTGPECPIFGLCVLRDVARIVVGWQIDGETFIENIPARLDNPEAEEGDAFAFHLRSPFACLRLGTTLKSLQQYSKDLRAKAESNWTWMQAQGKVPATGWCTR